MRAQGIRGEDGKLTKDLLAVDGGSTALGSAAATATARDGGEKSNLLHEGFSKLGAPHMVVLVCFAEGVG